MGSNNGSEYLLDLTTAEALPSVRIDGQSYGLRIDVEYAELLRLRDMGRRIQEIAESEERTEQEDAELGDLLKREIAAVLKAPEEVLARLTDLQRFQLVTVFSNEVEERIAGPTKAATKTSRG